MDLDSDVEAVTKALVATHRPFAEATIARLVRRAFAAHAEATVTTYLPVLVEREVGAQLRALTYDAEPAPATAR